MSGYVIDVNVFIAASTPDADFHSVRADHVPIEELARAFEWLAEFRDDETAQLVLDYDHLIWKEYHKSLSQQGFGYIVATEKYVNARFHQVSVTEDGASLSDDLVQVVDDPDDRKYVAVALKDDDCTIVNAVDPGWCDWEEALSNEGVDIVQLLRDWLC